jgi:hypothetical protein
VRLGAPVLAVDALLMVVELPIPERPRPSS